MTNNFVIWETTLMTTGNLTCPNCHHHRFEVKAVTGNRLLNKIEKIMINLGIPKGWFNNILVRCKTCKYYWKA